MASVVGGVGNRVGVDIGSGVEDQGVGAGGRSETESVAAVSVVVSETAPAASYGRRRCGPSSPRTVSAALALAVALGLYTSGTTLQAQKSGAVSHEAETRALEPTGHH